MYKLLMNNFISVIRKLFQAFKASGFQRKVLVNNKEKKSTISIQLELGLRIYQLKTVLILKLKKQWPI